MKILERQILAVVIAIAVVVPSASAQQRGRGGFGSFGGGATGLVTIAASEAVQKDLGLSADTSSKLRELREDYVAALQKENQNAGVSFEGFQDLSREERQKLTTKMTEINTKLNDEFNPKVKALVSADHHKRLEQIQLQYNLRNRGPGALTYKDVAAELKLTEDQNKKLQDLQTEFDAKQRELFTGGGPGNQEGFTKLREQRTAKTIEVLTAEQKETLNKLKGAEFDVSQLSFGGRGRRGNN